MQLLVYYHVIKIFKYESYDSSIIMTHFQLSMAKWLSLGFSFIMASVFIGIIIEGVNCPLAPSFLFFMALVGMTHITYLRLI